MKKRTRKARPIPTACPCCSGKPYAECCKPFHEGEAQPERAEQLVRARFSAFALGMPEYVWRTLHSAHEDRAVPHDQFVAQLGRSMGNAKYRRLRILDQSPPDAHGISRVLFAADVQQLKRDLSFVEQSDFVEEDGELRYIVGQTRPRSELGHDDADMRLDHWECGHHHHH